MLGILRRPGGSQGGVPCLRGLSGEGTKLLHPGPSGAGGRASAQLLRNRVRGVCVLSGPPGPGHSDACDHPRCGAGAEARAEHRRREGHLALCEVRIRELHRRRRVPAGHRHHGQRYSRGPGRPATEVHAAGRSHSRRHDYRGEPGGGRDAASPTRPPHHRHPLHGSAAGGVGCGGNSRTGRALQGWRSVPTYGAQPFSTHSRLRKRGPG